MPPPLELLRRSDEPTLESLTCRSACRCFLLSHTIHVPTNLCVRIERTSSVVLLSSKTCNSATSDIDKWSMHSKKPIASVDWQSIQKAFNAADFWNLPEYVPDRGRFDYVNHVIELFDSSHYHVISRMDLDNDLQVLFDRLLILADLYQEDE